MSITASGNVTGSGVSFYITGGNITSQASGNVTFTAPTTGTDPGILFWQASTDSSAAAVASSGNWNVTGALYFPTAALTFGGSGNVNSSNPNYTILVADTITFSGSGNLNDNNIPSGLPTGGSTTPVVLVE